MATARKNKEDRTLYRPVISTDVMGNRNVEMRAVEAWVQPAHVDLVQPNPLHQAVVSAQLEEMKMLSEKLKKEAKLKEFQEEVRKRVRNQSIAKKREVHEISCQQQRATEKRMLQQSERLWGTMYGDVCYNKVFNHHHMQPQAARKLTLESKTETVPQKINKDEIVDLVHAARHRLSQRQVFTKRYDKRPTDEFRDSGQLTSPDRGNDQIPEDGEVFRNCPGKKSVNFNCDLVMDSKSSLKVDDESSSVHGDEAALRRSANREGGVAKVDSGVVGGGVDHKQQAAQLALCRRMFMDQERGKVKENMRLKEHRSRIAKLKEAKELKRMTEEEISLQVTEPLDPVSGVTEQEIIERKQLDSAISAETMRLRSEKMQKLREMERYMEALKQRLKERADRQGIDIPPLCLCSDTVWQTSPYTCANNCIFYQNPKEFSKALQSLMKSAELSR